MATELLIPLTTFVIVTLITPGPNNIMLMASGLNYGFRRTLPHLFGVALGFAFMVLLVGLGLGTVFEALPWLYAVLKWVGVAYLLYLAWGIASADPSAKEEPGAAGGAGRPLTFWQAAVFQWVNPKAWVMAVGGISAYAAIASFPLNAVLIAGLFGGLGFGSSGAWVAFGQGLRRLLSNARALRAFNIAMALALVASLVPVVVEGWR